ncbi:Oidioi.mRNA.OKI2018_I69.chr2.g6304.t1.cds [Oikopleura dioica]|uniref:Oidioi.mRNA.OKI2018_I69.chr2.g6304.t1.cds n=1 Tax=Oikopleura dioica TaxID=34765 RepID=A0ABN7T6F9_OIKDI|nr:Oidioi.mRNA.OKI2018_I69.chr2.g6304.t1.cds [Oikopleura dioica]
MKKLLALVASTAVVTCEPACFLPTDNLRQDGKVETCQSQWEFEIKGRTITHYGFLPSENSSAHKSFNDTFNFCQSHGLQSLVIHSRDHQEDVTEKLEEMINETGTGAAMHSNFWLSMERDQKTKDFQWKSWFELPSNYDDYVEGYCPIDDASDNDGVSFWKTPPDANSRTEHCAVMRIHYPDTEGVKNWETTACSSDQNGQLGTSHGFVCVSDPDWKMLDDDCLIIFPTTTTTTTTSTKTTTTTSTKYTGPPTESSSTQGPGVTDNPEGTDGPTESTTKSTSTKDPSNPGTDPNNPDNGSSSSTTTTTTTTTKESEDVNVGIIVGGVLGGLFFLVLIIFIIMRCLKPDNSIEDEEDEIDMSA